MKIMDHRVRACLIAIAVSTVIVTLVADTRVQPPNRQTLVGTWIGFDQDRLTFARLELNQEGKGFFATTFVTNAARLYSIEAWSLTNFSLNVSLIPQDADAEPVYLRGVVEHPQLALEIGGKNGDWHRSITLYDESELSSRNKRVKERIESYKKTAKKKQ